MHNPDTPAPHTQMSWYGTNEEASQDFFMGRLAFPIQATGLMDINSWSCYFSLLSTFIPLETEEIKGKRNSNDETNIERFQHDSIFISRLNSNHCMRLKERKIIL